MRTQGITAHGNRPWKRAPIAVLKVRGSTHDRDLRELKIDANGMHIGRVFSNVTGILSGQISVITDDELARSQGALGQIPDRARDG